MKKPTKQSKALKTVFISLIALLILTVCLFVLLLVSVSGFKGFAEKIIGQIPPAASYIPPVSESTSGGGELSSDTAAQTSASLTDTASDGNVINTSKRYNHSSLNKDIGGVKYDFSNFPNYLSTSRTAR